MLFGPLKPVFQTLRFRLTAWVTLVVVLIVGITLLSIRQVVLHTLKDEFNQRLKRDMNYVRLAMEKYFPNKDALFQKINKEALFQEMNLNAMGHLHVDWFVELYDEQGNLLGGSQNSSKFKLKPPNLPFADSELRDEGPVRLLETKFEGAHLPPMIVRMGSTRLSLDDDIALLNWIMVLASASILILAPVSGYFLAGRATRPLSWIISTTARLEPKNLEERLPIRGTGDELDQLSLTINGMLDRIGNYLESNRDFIANAAHELRSPLAAIRSSVDVALDRPRSPDDYALLLSDVAEECARLTNLVNRLLVLAEGDAGRLAPRDHQAQLDKVVRDAVNMFEAVAESKGVELKVSNLSPVAVPGEEYHLRQVVRNLLDNAIKFTPAAGKVTVDLATDRDKKQTRLRVSDSGAGIASEDLPRIFERFYRGDKARSREQNPGGNGLGLAICQAIVSALDGDIEVQSRLGQGSTFTVTLPLA